MSANSSIQPSPRLGSLFFLATLLSAALGCSPPKKATTVTGSVLYKGQPVPMGVVHFYGANNQMAAGLLREDGTFDATDVPVGEVKVTVEAKDPRQYAAKMQGAPPSQAAPGSNDPGPKFVEIPAKYKNVETSGLVFTIKSGVPLRIQIE